LYPSLDVLRARQFGGTAINRHQIVTATKPGNNDSLESD
jgi:hypothetical protein